MGVVTGGGGGGTPFNGGTITGKLNVAPTVPGTPAPIVVVVPSHGGSPAFSVQNNLANEVLTVSDIGDMTMSSAFSVGGNTSLGGIANAVQLYLNAGPAQASDIVQVFDSVGNTPLSFDKNGRVVFRVHTAPADGDLAAGDCSLWFDQTNGAAKLMVKAKSANGTVVSGSLALA